jgi:tetratricopeptide (TPR) repeat protein
MTLSDFTPQTPLAELIAADFSAASPDELLALSSLLIDLGGDAGSKAALARAETVLDALDALDAPPLQARGHYNRSNIWSYRRHWEAQDGGWTWSSPALEAELIELRRAIAHPGFAFHPPLAKAQVFTNLGNSLNHIGRSVEAIEAWDRALGQEPRLAMANGNRGLGLGHYALSLHDTGHNLVMACAAHEALRASIAPDALVESDGLESAFQGFETYAEAINAQIDVAHTRSTFDLDGYSLGRGKPERAYRRWCLDNRLFLNPLNDTGAHSIAATDSMNLPSITVGFDERGPGPPAVIRFFNSLKQEFVSARYALYEGLTAEGVHFADREVFLYNTLDYPSVGQGVERLKMAFRNAYAILDKVGFLLNLHLKLGHPERRVSFRNLWFEGGKGKVLHPGLNGLPNWPLRGLFWLAKDVFEDAFKQVTEPDAEALYDLRNHLEHKFVLVHDDFCRAVSPSPAPPAPPGLFDLSFDSLARRTLRQLKLARAALIYLTLAVHAEERRKAEARGDGLVMPMTMGRYEDSWKRRD